MDYRNKKNTIYITDKVVIFNLLKNKNISSICLDSLINNLERKKIFLKEYKYFDDKLRKFGEKNYFHYKKDKINSIYNSFRHDIPRQYVGVNFLMISLKRIIVKKNIKKIIYLNDLVSYGNDILNKSFYAEEIIVILLIPILDMVRLFITRTFNGKNPFMGDATHIHHIVQTKYHKNKLPYIMIILIFFPLLFLLFTNVNYYLIIISQFLAYTYLVLRFKKI